MKKCPFCAESIQDEAIKCRYCGSMLRLDAPTPPGSAGGDGVAEEARQRLLVEGKIEVIKFVRQRTGLDLMRAKAYVEALQAGQDPDQAAAAKTKNTGSLGCVALILLIVAVVAALLVFGRMR